MTNTIKFPQNHILQLAPFDQSTKLHTGRIFLSLFNAFFDVITVNGSFKRKELIDYILKNIETSEKIHEYSEIFVKQNIFGDPDREPQAREFVTYTSIIQLKEKVLMEIMHGDVRIFFEKNIDVQEYIDLLFKFQSKPNTRGIFSVIVYSDYSDSNYDLMEFAAKDTDIDIGKTYNDDFREVDSNIKQFLSGDMNNGFVLLHGKQGTGKTTYIRHLIKTIQKRFIYMPVHMAGSMDNPKFLPFLVHYPDSILVIEDCEEILKSREQTNISNFGIANLLNIGDGLLSDALKLKIIFTFNTNLEKIDQAILRKGRMKARYEFKDLETPKVNRLFKELNIQGIEPKPMTVADIFNAADKNFDTSNSTSKIGFSSK